MLRTNNRLRKIRIIQKGHTGGLGYTIGLSLPPYFERWLGINVSVKESGGCIILESGTKPIALSKMEMRFNTKKMEDIFI